mgnify:CR=1 FL=1
MKRIVSISLGSSKRDHTFETELLGERVVLERIGTDGDIEKLKSLFRELDEKVDAFGLGGADIYLVTGKRRYILREPYLWTREAKITPVADGSGMKNTLEREVVKYLSEKGIVKKDTKALVMTGVDRTGMAEGFAKVCDKVIFGDFPFSLGIPIYILSLIHI